MKNKNIKKTKIFLSATLFIMSFIATFSLCVFDIVYPDEISCFEGEKLDGIICFEEDSAQAISFVEEQEEHGIRSVDGEVSLMGKLPLKKVEMNYFKEKKLVPGGFAFGVRFSTKGVVIVGFSEITSSEKSFSPAREASFEIGDIITAADGREINTAQELSEIIENSGGKEVLFNIIRKGDEVSIKLKPSFSDKDNKYKTGLWIRDYTAGIGTVTYVDPENNKFGGLGHGICDSQTKNLLPLRKADVFDVTITDIKKGEEGNPGELNGVFGNQEIGSLYSNTECGVFGTFIKKKSFDELKALPIALKNEIKYGKAYIISTVNEDNVREYEIEIESIESADNPTKNMLIKVTDKELLSKTGGIVQGMSGSPIIQDGKIIGAVTHVLVNDPTKGYGIFIENMLKSS